MSPLERSIISTITYFDIFEYPMTLMEVWKWLYADGESQSTSVSLKELKETLTSSPKLKSIIESQDGFYFLTGRSQNIRTRQERYKFAEKKFKRARRVARLIRFIPYIKLVAICNSLGYANARKKSDIDFFIITGRNDIWKARLFTVWLLKLLRLRPRKGRRQDTLCFSFFVSEDHMDLSDLMLKKQSDRDDEVPDDVYFAYWFTQISILFDRRNYYDMLWKSNQWIKEIFPNIFAREENSRRQLQSNRAVDVLGFIVEKIFSGKFGELVENGSRRIQKKIMPDILTSMAQEDNTRVVIDDTCLKMHHNDRRNLYKAMWEDRIARVIKKAV